ncbi:putative inorganic ion transporter [Triangularia verruculosa]|uniref:Inorganic ion transporter n=1 Tax=Triangularia verruculosa TaxID=2587418 RepID=A0AAN7AUD1_9PEZI|nr:putative inorganic ion transporter [Triangularia verruculosa]
MAIRKLSKRKRVSAIIAISSAFFVCELVVAIKTSSLALYADAIHYLNDLLGYVVTLVAIIISERSGSPQDLSFGWQRSTLLGAFFNGSFLFALALSILFQSIERFIKMEKVDDPLLVLIVGGVGLALNLVSFAFLHEHDHGHGHGHSHGPTHGHSHGHSYHHEHSSHTHDSPQNNHHHAHGLGHHCKKNGNSELVKHGGDTTSSATVLNEPSPKASCVDIETDGTTSPIATTDSHSEHRHIVHIGKPPLGDLNMLAAKFHVLGDIAGNLGVMVAAAIIQYVRPGADDAFDHKYYADPAISLGISILIFCTAIPILRESGAILLQSAPAGVNLIDIKHDIEKIPGVHTVHELHVWRLNQEKSIASAHVVVSDPDMAKFMAKAKTISECLHAYGIHSATLQPELIRASLTPTGCQISCGSGMCEKLTCCSVSVSTDAGQD